MKDRLRRYKLTPAGGGLLLLAAAAIGVLLAGSPSQQTPATVVLVVILMVLVVQPGGTRDAWSRTLGERREEFHPVVRGDSEAPREDAEEDPAWAPERARRDADHQ